MFNFKVSKNVKIGIMCSIVNPDSPQKFKTPKSFDFGVFFIYKTDKNTLLLKVSLFSANFD